MGFRFWKRVKVAPGVSINFSKSGASLSLGPRGAKVTVGPRGTQTTVGLPGSGLFYTTRLSSNKSSRESAGKPSAHEPMIAPEDRLNLGFFKRLSIPEDEREFTDGLKLYIQGKEEEAISHLQKSTQIADGAFLLGFLLLKRDHLDDAARCLQSALSKQDQIGVYFSKYGINALMSLPITEEVFAHIGPNPRGAMLAIVEIYQRLGKIYDAVAILEKLLPSMPDDVVVRLSLAELIIEEFPPNKVNFDRVLQLAEGVNNDSLVHTALILYKVKAMRGLGLLDGARDLITAALRKKSDRPNELMSALRYERALIYEGIGQDKRARAEFEKIYADNPNFEDVAKRLGM